MIKYDKYRLVIEDVMNMTYDEKLQKIISKLKDERVLSRKGHKTKVLFNDKSFTKVRIQDACKILLQLQDDEKALHITKVISSALNEPGELVNFPASKDEYESAEIIAVELDEAFDQWYEAYLLKEKSKPQNLDWLNLLKILDVCVDIDSQLQITKEIRITIPSFPYPCIGRFRELFPIDNTGTRQNYQQHRWDGVKYLEKEGVLRQTRFDNNDPLGYAMIDMTVGISRFEDMYKIVKIEYQKRKEANKLAQSKNEEKTDISNNEHISKNQPRWPTDYVWTGNEYVFGNLGQIAFTSTDRKHIFKTLTEKKGNWATINELKRDKDAGYVRTTIKQIEGRLPGGVKKVLKIISTQDDDSEEKPKMGAYRIKLLHS